ncbi:MAG TPA: PEGA domain-containing protein [Bacteroidetes bacterium]|nr:PEGA domain-containing protein [Bacteroidota bacterium]
MKKQFLILSKTTAVLVAISLFFSSCVSTTKIITIPPDAKIYIGDEYVGNSPYLMSDSKIVGSCSDITIKKEGYKDFYTQICRDEKVDAGAIVGGIFFTIPFLWAMKYKPKHTYELEPVDE